jgi:monothiol glutaredoxin
MGRSTPSRFRPWFLSRVFRNYGTTRRALPTMQAMADPQLKKKVEELIAANPVLLFMKGTPEMPRCGFSMRVVQVLDSMDVEYGAIDVLPALQPLREVTAEISDWQTFPQLYVNGELIGGADIVEEMFDSGELAEALGVEQPQVAAAPAQATPPAQSPPLQIDGS